MKLIVKIEASVTEIDLDDYFDEDEDQEDFDMLYDGFIHEIITNSDYTYEVVDA